MHFNKMQQRPETVNHQISTLDYSSFLEVHFNQGAVEKRSLSFHRNEKIEPNKNPFWPAHNAIELAKKLYEKFNSSGEPLVLCISGGLDSQAMLTAFQASGVPVQAAVLKFKDGLNEHDIGNAASALTQMGIKIQYHEIDIRKFYEDGTFMEYAISGCTNSPQFAAHIWFAHQIQGVPVFAGEPWHLIPAQEQKKESIFIPHYKEYGTEISLRKKGRACISHFFETSAEWLEDLLNEEKFRYRPRHADPKISYRAKYTYYRQMGFPISMPAALVKLTGFERLYSLIATEHNLDDYYYFNELYRKPLEKIFPPAVRREFYTERFSGEFWTKLSSTKVK